MYPLECSVLSPVLVFQSRSSRRDCELIRLLRNFTCISVSSSESNQSVPKTSESVPRLKQAEESEYRLDDWSFQGLRIRGYG
jgi:hypothetical protein